MQESQELKDLVAAWFAGATNADATLVDERVSKEPGTRLVGSDPGEWMQGGAAIATFLRGEVEDAGGAVTFAPSETEAFSEGSVGWATSRLTISMPDGRSVTPRWSAVFHQEDGVWKFVQTHASIAVPNDQIGWTYDG